MFDKETLLELNTYLINWHIKKINKREKDADRKLFDLFDRLIKNEIIYEYGKIQVAYLRHIFTLAIRLNKLDWFTLFLEKHKDKIRVNPSEEWKYYNFFKAKLLYAKNEHDKASQLLEDITLEDSLTEMDLRILQFKIAFEEAKAIRVFEYALNYYLKNYLNRLKKMKLETQYKNSYKDFFSAASTLCKFAICPDKRKKNRLIAVLKNEKLMQRKWLEKQMLRLNK